MHVKADRIIFIVALLESVALQNTVTVQKVSLKATVALVRYCGSTQSQWSNTR